MSFHSKLKDPLYVGPFVRWGSQEIHILSFDFDAPTLEFVGRCGWPGETGVRRFQRHRSGEQIWAERLDLIDAMHMAGAAWWDHYDEPTNYRPRTGSRPHCGIPVNCDLATLQEAHALHVAGLSLRAVARELVAHTQYASAQTMANQLSTLFHNRGWYVRPRVEAIVAHNKARTFRPQCSFIHTYGPRRGTRCVKRCISSDEWCWHHSPEQLHLRIPDLRGRERRAA